VEADIHPSAIVDAGATLGEGTRVWHWTHISSGAVIGRGCSFGQNVYVGNQVVIGDNVRVQNNVSLYDGVTLEDDVFCGPSMVFTNVTNPRAHVSRKHEYKPTRVGRGASIGATSFFPSKPLGCYGDGGALFTNDDELAKAMREIRVHGQERRYYHTRIGNQWADGHAASRHPAGQTGSVRLGGGTASGNRGAIQ
jgi:acyl-[acyl carrier protein]--UDP-N-acetylglucosamine O-acyltransferase